MSHESTADESASNVLRTTRRRVLAGLAAAGTVGLGASSIQGEDDYACRSGADRPAWTAFDHAKIAKYSSGWGPEGISAEYFDPQPLASVDQVALLKYRGAVWAPHVDPTPGDDTEGSWQHTFELSTFGISQKLREGFEGVTQDKQDNNESTRDLFEPGYAPDIAMTRLSYLPEPSEREGAFRVHPKLEVTALDEEDDSSVDVSQDAVAVSARRDPDLFYFADGASLSDAVRRPSEQVRDEQTETEESDNLPLSLVTDALARQNWTGSLTGDGEQVKEWTDFTFEASDTGGQGRSNGIDLLQPLGIVGDAAAKLTDRAWIKRVNTEFGRVMYGVDFLQTTGELLDKPDPIDPDRTYFYEGFEVRNAQDNPVSFGSVMFDVHIAPDEPGMVEARPKTFFGDTLDGNDDMFLGSDIQIRLNPLPVPDDPSPGDVERRDRRCAAELAGMESVHSIPDRFGDPRDLSKRDISKGKAFLHTTPEPPRPVIDTQDPITFVDEMRESDSVDVAGETVTFDASKSIGGGSAIQQYTWTIDELDPDTFAVIDTLSDGKTPNSSALEWGVPDAADTGSVYRVTLKVSVDNDRLDGDNERLGRTSRVFPAANVDASDPTVTLEDSDLNDYRIAFEMAVRLDVDHLSVDRVMVKRDGEHIGEFRTDPTSITFTAPRRSDKSTTVAVGVWDSLGRYTETEKELVSEEQYGDNSASMQSLDIDRSEIDPVGTTRPKDPDEDGQFEDIDADGDVDEKDVRRLFNSREKSAITNNTAAYDYNGDGDVALEEVIHLFEST